MSQASDVQVYYAEREIADPAPDTDDLIAATAAIIREACRAAFDRYGQRIDRIALGMPSYQAHGGGEAKRASQRRHEAVDLSRVRSEFGSSEFELLLMGEAQAAGFGLDLDVRTEEAFVIIVDVGAGTTDLALVPFRRSRGRMLAGDPEFTSTERFAGRNLNEAISIALRSDKDIAKAYSAMDKRSWQLLIEEDIESIKRAIDSTSRNFRIPFHRYAAAPDNGLCENPEQRALLKTCPIELSLETPALQRELGRACEHWSDVVSTFLAHARAKAGTAGVSAIQLVGGAFYFSPLQAQLREAANKAGLSGVPVVFSPAGDEAQTVVARGLARQAALSN